MSPNEHFSRHTIHHGGFSQRPLGSLDFRSFILYPQPRVSAISHHQRTATCHIILCNKGYSFSGFLPASSVATLTMPVTAIISPGTHVPMRSEVSSQSMVRGMRPASASPLDRLSETKHNRNLYQHIIWTLLY